MEREDRAFKDGKSASNPALNYKEGAGQSLIPQITEEDNDFFDRLFEEDSKDAENEFFEVPDDIDEELKKDIFQYYKQLSNESESENDDNEIEALESVTEENENPSAVHEVIENERDVKEMSDRIQEAVGQEDDLDELLGKIEDIKGSMKNNADENEYLQDQNMKDEEMQDADIQELLGGLFSDTMKDVYQEPEGSEESEDDYLNLLNSIPDKNSSDLSWDEEKESEDSDSNDILSINDFMDDGEEFPEEESAAAKDNKKEAITDFPEIDFLQDSENTDELLNLIPDINEAKETDKKAKKKEKNSNQEKKNKKPKLFSRIFGNVKEERSEEEIKQLKDKVYSDADAKEKAELEKEEKKKAHLAAEEQKKKSAAEDKKIKAAEAKKAKAEKAKAAKAAKEAKKEEKLKKQQEIQSLIDEIDENEGRINKIGATLIFLLFITLAGVIIVGTPLYSYANSIQSAEKNFEFKHYDEAYQAIYGLDLKEEDKELYNKIVTVMYVKKQLNSYQNYYDLEMYPEAMDSLIKGLRRYDNYIAVAQSYGIESDLNGVKAQLLTALKDVYHLTEKEANSLTEYKDQAQYSAKVYEYVEERFIPPVKEEPKLDDTDTDIDNGIEV